MLGFATGVLRGALTLSALSFDLDHPSVFVDDESLMDFSVCGPEEHDLLLDSPSLSPIAAPCEDPEFTANYRLPENANHSPRPKFRDSEGASQRIPSSDHSMWSEGGLFGTILRFIRFILSEFFGLTGWDDSDKLSVIESDSNINGIKNNQAPQTTMESPCANFSIYHVDYDSCLLSLYSPEFIEESIRIAEENSLFFTPNVVIQPEFIRHSDIEFPSELFKSSLAQLDSPKDEKGIFASEHRVLALLRCQANPLLCAAEIDSVGIPLCVRPVHRASTPALHTFMHSLKASFGFAKESFTEVSMTDDMHIVDRPMGGPSDFVYIKLADLRRWINTGEESTEKNRKDTSSPYERLQTKLRLLEMFETVDGLRKVPQPDCFTPSSDGRPFTDPAKGKAAEARNNLPSPNPSKANNGRNLTAKYRRSADSDLHCLSRECQNRYGSKILTDSSALGIFKVPREENSQLLRALQSTSARLHRRKLVNGTAVASFYAQEYYRFERPVSNHSSTMEKIQRRQRYLFHIPEDRIFTFLLTCPVRFQQ